MIRLEGVSRTYLLGDEPVHALVDITEHIEPGEHVAIMGPSGSGKSTLLNVVGCLDRPDAGTYWLNGREVGQLSDDELTARPPPHDRLRLPGLPSGAAPDRGENVELPMVFAGLSRSERRKRVAAALAEVGLRDRAAHRPNQLSGGERQRAALARATVMGPRLLLADEPTGNLDTASGKQILDLLDRMNDEGITLVVVTHDPNVARRADRIIVLVDGRIARRVQGSEVASVADLFT